MTKQELLTRVWEENQDLKKKDVEAVVASLFDIATDELQTSGSFKYAGFGTFKVKQRAARKGRNPQTGKSLKIPARKAVTFKAASSLKDSVNN